MEVLERSNTTIAEAVKALASSCRVDVAGLPFGGVALMLREFSRATNEPLVVVTEDLDAARRLGEDIRFFLGVHRDEQRQADVLVYPNEDATPYVDVAPDRGATMERLSALFHLAHGLSWRFLMVPAPALVRRVPPKQAIIEHSCVVRAEEELDRTQFLTLLERAGYLRVPVAEDPGTFAVRGAIIDVFSPHAQYPARIEFDDWLVLSIKFFDPEDQRTIESVTEIFVHPVRDTLVNEEQRAKAQERIRALCDAIDLPSSKSRQLVEDVAAGRFFLGLEGLLPAFYPELQSLFDFVSSDVRTVIVDPTAVVRAVHHELSRAKKDRLAKTESAWPAFPLEAHFLGEAETAERLFPRPMALIHKLAVIGSEAEENDTSPLSEIESYTEANLVRFAGEDQTVLRAELKAQRALKGRGDALAPLAKRTMHWLESGMRVFFCARTRTQADRLASLLRGAEVPVSAPKEFDGALASSGSTEGRAQVVLGNLADGFVLPSEAVSWVTEEEIFGSRTHRAAESRRVKKTAQAFLEDLRELKPGDFVVHIEHGVGRYLGLEHKSLGQSPMERLRGDKVIRVEVLVVEYAGGDRLFLPVTRLNQISKHSGREGQQVRLDRLGGQTFARTKAKVRQDVQQMADELLKLYAQRATVRREVLVQRDRVYAEFEATFPFDETADQARTIEEVLKDLESPQPMDRIVCGDVGFGKTEVALRAAFRVALSGKQVAMLCPTTVLAQQHLRTFQDRLQDYPVRIEPLSRFVDKKDQAKILGALKDGMVDIVIGTHRLLSKDVHFKDLGLLIVDEEQRFGVSHKERIKQLRTEVDVLTLTATPIPRTLQLAIGGLRDISLISTPPVDRRAVRTFVCRWDDHLIVEAVHRELARGGQTFFVYNRIEGLYERAQRLQELLPDTRIAVAHGQMREDALEQMMTDFVAGRYDVLCSTAIIESGLDIPRANTIFIDRADTFGLAQLYQLRGRVGRSKERAYCYLITPQPSQMSDEARFRLEAVERFTELGSGFHVASLDMELRGAGEILGAEQSGSVTAVGLELFMHMLEEAVAQLRGETPVHDMDPELTLDLEQYLPEDYIEDIGLRLSFYKRFASAQDENGVQELAAEMEDRFGPPPSQALQFVRAMRLKPLLREYRVLGCEATKDRVIFHLRADTPLDPAKVMGLVALPQSLWKLTPEMKLIRQFTESLEGDAIDRVDHVLRAIEALRK